MGGAIYYSINKAEKKEARAREFTAGTLWILIISSIILTLSIFFLNNPLLRLLGANGQLLFLGEKYISIIALGAGLQIIGTGLIPFIRNYGGALYAMFSMIAGFITNIILDYLFVWVFELGIISTSIIKIGIAPFGLAMTPNISLIIINRFSISYGGEQAIAVYACIAYIICIIDLILQGVGDGSQPLISQLYGEKNFDKLKNTRKLGYGFAIFLSLIGCIIIFFARGSLGILFGASDQVNTEIIKIIPIFLIPIPFVAINRITTASFYATEKSIFSYILTFIEPLFMLIFMFILPPLFGGQIMIWWSTAFARILSALLALILKRHTEY